MAQLTIQSLLDSMIANNAQQNYSGGSQQQYMYVPGQNGSIGGLTLTQGSNPNTPLWNGRNQADQIQPQITRENAPMRQMTDTERLFATLGSTGDNIASYWDFGGGQAQSLSDLTDPAKLAAFAANLPMGIIAAPFSAAQNLYEAATGTPVSTANLDTNEVSTYKYNTNERAASGVTGAIDALGTLAGGTGRLVGAGAGLVGKAFGKAESPVLKGFAKTTAGQLGFDALEEGSEEFVQSVAEDVKNDQFDEDSWGRALNAASLGAVGGVAMSGAAHGINRAVFGPQNQQQDNAEGNSTFTASGAEGVVTDQTATPIRWEYDKNAVATAMDGHGINSVVKAEMQKLDDTTNMAGSMSVMNGYVDDGVSADTGKVINSDRGLNPNEAMLGADNLFFAWNARTPGSRAEIAQAFASNQNNHDVAWATGELDRINKMRSWKDRANALNQMLVQLNQDGHTVEFAMGRNPATNPAGVAKMKLVGFSTTRNSGIALSNLTYTMFGMDTDGDLTQAFFSKNVPQAQSLTQMLVDRTTGKSNFDGDFFALTRGKVKADILNRAREKKRTLDDLVTALEGQNLNDSQKKRLAAAKSELKFMRAFLNTGNWENGGLTDDATTELLGSDFLNYSNESEFKNVDLWANFFSKWRHAEQIVSEVSKEVQGIDSGRARWEANNYADDVIANAMEDYDHSSQEIRDAWRTISEENEKRVSTKALMELMPPEMQDAVKRQYMTQGKIDETHGVLAAFMDFGWAISMLSNAGNPFFRQTMSVFLSVRPTTLELDWTNYGFDSRADAFSKMMAFAFKLTDVGLDVESALEGVFRVTVMLDAEQRFQSYGKSEQNWTTFSKCFADAYNEAIEDYNEAFTEDITSGLNLKKENVKKVPIKSENLDKKFGEEFLKIYGDRKIADVLPVPESDTFANGRSFNDVIEITQFDQSVWHSEFSYDESFAKFWPTLVKCYEAQQMHVARANIGVIEDLVKTLKANDVARLVKFTEHDGVITKVEIPEILSLFVQNAVETTATFIDDSVLLDLGIDTQEGFLASTWGQAFISGDVIRAKNAYISLQLTAQYLPIIQALSDIETDAGKWANAETYARKLAGNSPLHMAIYKFIKDKNIEPVKSLMSLDVSYDEKLQLFGYICGEEKGNEQKFFADVLNHSDDMATMSAVTNRLMRVRKMLNSTEKISQAQNEAEWKIIKSKYSDKKGDFMDTFRYLSSETMVEVNLHQVTSFIYSARNVGHESVEKGVSTLNATLLDLTLNAIKGGKKSFIDDMFSGLDVMDVNDFASSRQAFLRILWDPNATMRVFSKEQEGCLEITQKDLYTHFGITIDPEKGPNKNDFWQLCEACPRLLQMMVPHRVIATEGDAHTISAKLMRVGKVSDWAEAYIDNDRVKEIHEREQRNFVRNSMFDRPKFWELFTASLKPEVLTGAESMTDIENEVARKLDMWTDWFAWHLANPEQGEIAEQYAMNSRKEAVDGFMNNVTELVSRIGILQDVSKLTVFNPSASIQSLDTVFGFLNLIEVMDVIEKHGDTPTPQKTWEQLDEAANSALASVDQAEAASGVFNQKFGTTFKVETLSEAFAQFIGLDPDRSFSQFFGDLQRNYDDILAIKSCLINMLSEEQLAANHSKDQIDSFNSNIRGFITSWVAPENRDEIIAEIDAAGERTKKDIDAIADVEQLGTNVGSKVISGENGTAYGEPVFSDVILTKEAFSTETLTSDEAIEVVKKVYERLGRTYDFTDAHIKDLEKAYKAGPAEFDAYRIKVNGDILSASIDRMLRGTGVTSLNSNVFYQELVGRSNIEKMLKEVREDLDSYNEQSGRKLYYTPTSDSRPPMIPLHYQDAAQTAIATNAKMNANSASVGAGIGIDGFDTFDLGGFGLVKKTWLWNVARNSNPNGSNAFVHSLYKLICWAQEPQHLKAKKSTRALQNIVRRLKQDHEINKTQEIAITSLDVLKAQVEDRRDKVAKFYTDCFMVKDGPNEMALNEEVPKLFAHATTPYIELKVNVNGNIETRIFETSLLDNEEAAQKRFDKLTEDGVQIVGYKMPVLSVSEISSRIVRKVARAMEKSDRTLSDTEIEEVVDQALNNWQDYNKPEFSIAYVIGRMQPSQGAYDAAMPNDFTPTAVQQFNMLRRNKSADRIEAAWRKVGFINRDVKQRVPLKPEEQNQISAVNNKISDMLSQSIDEKNAKLFRENYAIVSHSVFDMKSNKLSNDSMEKRSLTKNEAYKSMEFMLNRPNCDVVSYGGVSHKPVDFIDFDDPSRLKESNEKMKLELARSLKEARDRGHSVLIPTEILDKWHDVIPASLYYYASNSSFTMFGEQVSLIDFDKFDGSHLDNGGISLDILPFDDKQLTLSVSIDNAGETDAWFLMHPLFSRTADVNQEYVIKTKSLISGRGPVSIVNSTEELTAVLASLKDHLEFIRDNNTGREFTNLDLDRYWLGKTIDVSAEARIESAIAFCEAVLGDNRGSEEFQSTIVDVRMQDCLGFVRRITDDGNIIYAPVYYDTSKAPREATMACIALEKATDDVVVKYEATLDFADYMVKGVVPGQPYKGVITVWTPDGYEKYCPSIDPCGYDEAFVVDTRNGRVGPHYCISKNTQDGRAVGFDKRRTVGNYSACVSRIGGNIFFRVENGVAKLNPDLHPQLLPSKIVDLVNGNPAAWREIASDQINVFRDPTLDKYFKNAVSEIMLKDGVPHLFFCPTDIRPIINDDGSLVGGDIIGRRKLRMNVMPAFVTANQHEILAVFNQINPDLCPPRVGMGLAEGYIFDECGNVMQVYGNGENAERRRIYAVFGEDTYQKYMTATGSDGTDAKRGYQHVITNMMRNGRYDPDVRRMIQYLSLKTMGRPVKIASDAAEDITRKSIEALEKRTGRKASLTYCSALYDRVNEVLSDPFMAPAITRHRSKCLDIVSELSTRHPLITDNDRTPLEESASARQRFTSAVSKFNRALGRNSGDELTAQQVVEIVCYTTGFSWSNNGAGAEYDSFTIGQFEDAINHMIPRIMAHETINDGMMYTGARSDQRVRIPVLPKGLARLVWESPAYRATYTRLSDFIDDHYKLAAETTRQQIALITDRKKQVALFNMLDAVSYDNGRTTLSGWIKGNTNPYDINQTAKQMGSVLRGFDADWAPKYDEMQQLNAEKFDHYQKYSARHGQSIVNSGDDVVIHYKGKNRNMANKIMDSLASERRTIGMTYPELFLGNIGERFVRNRQNSGALYLGRMGIGPFAIPDEHTISRKTIKAVVENAEFRKFFSAWQAAEQLGLREELQFNITKYGRDIDKAITETLKDRTLIERWEQKFLNVMSGKDVFIGGEIKNFLDMFSILASNEEHLWWFENRDGSKLIEQKLESDPVGWFLDNATNYSGHVSADYNIIYRALNWAKSGDMAQRNLLSAIYSELAKNYSAVNFFTTTIIYPYMQYGTNRLGRIANLFAPISSLHYLLTKSAMSGVLGEVVIGKNGDEKIRIKDLPIDDVQIYSSFQQALAVDAMHIGPTILAIFLVSIIGAIEPPEDEDKWGNFKEWTYFGLRGDFAWWMEDILGLTLPMAAFMRSAELGKPRFDLIVNGLTYYLSNNPAIKVADAVSVLFDPMAELYSDYENDVEGYAKAQGGAPSWSEFIMGKGKTIGLSFVTQFATPGILREVYNMGQQYEASYKKVFETDATGQLTKDAKENNKTQYTDYSDAILRKYTRYNPVLGWLADCLYHPTTGYMATEMPRTVVYDPFQMNSMEALSIYNDPWTKKDEKSYTEKLAVASEVICLLQTYSIADLQKQGFAIDSATREFTSEFIHDQIAQLKRDWNTMRGNGQLDYYVLGNGNWSLGQERYSQLYQAHNDQVSFWQDLYYNKLWDDGLVNLVQYNRVATGYEQDSNGEWYATGYKPLQMLPFTLAPTETPGDYKKVMSAEDDYATMSAVTGESMGERGLVPVQQGKVATPSLDSWGADGTDTSYSKSRQKNSQYYNDSTSSESSSSGTTVRYSGGSGGYRRSGGGSGGSGGGGYTRFNAPNVGSQSSSYGAKYSTHRVQSTQYDYLRPGVSTKGSREPYKRSD